MKKIMFLICSLTIFSCINLNAGETAIANAATELEQSIVELEKVSAQLATMSNTREARNTVITEIERLRQIRNTLLATTDGNSTAPGQRTRAEIETATESQSFNLDFFDDDSE